MAGRAFSVEGRRFAWSTCFCVSRDDTPGNAVWYSARSRAAERGFCLLCNFTQTHARHVKLDIRVLLVELLSWCVFDPYHIDNSEKLRGIFVLLVPYTCSPHHTTPRHTTPHLPPTTEHKAARDMDSFAPRSASINDSTAPLCPTVHEPFYRLRT